MYSQVVGIRNTSEAVLRPQCIHLVAVLLTADLGQYNYYTDQGEMGELLYYNILGY